MRIPHSTAVTFATYGLGSSVWPASSKELSGDWMENPDFPGRQELALIIMHVYMFVHDLPFEDMRVYKVWVQTVETLSTSHSNRITINRSGAFEGAVPRPSGGADAAAAPRGASGGANNKDEDKPKPKPKAKAKTPDQTARAATLLDYSQ